MPPPGGVAVRVSTACPVPPSPAARRRAPAAHPRPARGPQAATAGPQPAPGAARRSAPHPTVLPAEPTVSGPAGLRAMDRAPSYWPPATRPPGSGFGVGIQAPGPGSEPRAPELRAPGGGPGGGSRVARPLRARVTPKGLVGLRASGCSGSSGSSGAPGGSAPELSRRELSRTPAPPFAMRTPEGRARRRSPDPALCDTPANVRLRRRGQLSSSSIRKPRIGDGACCIGCWPCGRTGAIGCVMAGDICCWPP